MASIVGDDEMREVLVNTLKEETRGRQKRLHPVAVLRSGRPDLDCLVHGDLPHNGAS